MYTCAEVAESEWCEHRLYVDEVVELQSDVSIIILLPASHNICSAPGYVGLRSDIVTADVPLQVFEISRHHSPSTATNAAENKVSEKMSLSY